MNRPIRYLPNVVAQGLGRIVTLGANLTILALVARVLGPEIFGEFAYALTFFGALAIIADLGTGAVLGKQLTGAQGEDRKLYWGNFLILRASFSLALIGPSLVLAYLLRADLFFQLAIGCLALPFLVARFFEPVFQVQHHPWYATYASAAYGIVYLLCVLASLFVSRSLDGMITAHVGANAFYALFALTLAIRVLRPTLSLNAGVVRRIVALSLPIWVSSLFGVINGRAGVFMLGLMQTNVEVGIYVAGLRFFDMGALLAFMLMNPLVPVFTEKSTGGRELLRRDASELTEKLAVVLIPGAILTPSVSAPLIALLFGEGFESSAAVMNVLAWVGVLVFFALLSSAVNVSIGVVRHAYWSSALAALISLSLNYLWIPKYGAVGPAWAMLVSEIVLVAISFFYTTTGLGGVFRARRWLGIAIANFLLWISASTSPTGWSGVAWMLGSLTLYGIVVYRFYLNR